jgi:hypothetical protein
MGYKEEETTDYTDSTDFIAFGICEIGVICGFFFQSVNRISTMRRIHDC